MITNLIDNHYQFTGDEYDFETAYNYAVERYQAGRWGRFLSPDILGGALINPQSLNRYAYVLNNPCTLIDPFGLAPQCTFSVKGGSNLSNTTKNTINDILKQADIGATFSNGDTGDVTIQQNATDAQTTVGGTVRDGNTPVIGGGFSFINNNLVTSEFNSVMQPPTGYPVPNYDLGLGRVIAHELGHALGLDDTTTGDNLMGGHTADQNFNKNSNTFKLDGNQQKALLSKCQDLQKAHHPGAGGGGGGGGGQGGGIGPRPDPGDLILLLMADPGDGLTPHVTVRISVAP